MTADARALLQRIRDEALFAEDGKEWRDRIDAFIATPAAPAAPAEPVAWMHESGNACYAGPNCSVDGYTIPLYAAPPPPPTEAEDAARWRLYIECERKSGNCAMVHSPNVRVPCDTTNCQTFIAAARRAQEKGNG